MSLAVIQHETRQVSYSTFNIDVDEHHVMLKDKSKTHSFHETEPKYETKAPKRNNDVVTKFQFYVLCSQ